MASHRTLTLIAFFPVVFNHGALGLRVRTQAGDLLDLTLSRDLARKLGADLIAAADSDAIGPRTTPKAPAAPCSRASVPAPCSEIAPKPDEDRRARHLAAAREWLALAEPRPVRKHWCRDRGLSDALLINALEHEKANPGQPWPYNKTGRGDQMAPEQVAACRAAWHRYLTDKKVSLATLAADVGVAISSMKARWAIFEKEPGAPVLKPSGKLR